MNSEVTACFPKILLDNEEDVKLRRETVEVKRNEAHVHSPIPSREVNPVLWADSISDLTDESLMEQLREGNRDALAALFRRYSRLVRAVAQRILREPFEADDLLQEVFLFLFRNTLQFDSTRGSARSWIVQITYHRAFDRRRHLASRRVYTNKPLADSEAETCGFGSEADVYLHSLQARLGTELLWRIEESLSEDQLQVIRLHFFEGYTIEEIAVKVGQSTGNIFNRYYRGLEKMRKQIFSAKLPTK
jgi:RNA polymerase sigma-70 factor, ECF subfamily